MTCKNRGLATPHRTRQGPCDLQESRLGHSASYPAGPIRPARITAWPLRIVPGRAHVKCKNRGLATPHRTRIGPNLQESRLRACAPQPHTPITQTPSRVHSIQQEEEQRRRRRSKGGGGGGEELRGGLVLHGFRTLSTFYAPRCLPPLRSIQCTFGGSPLHPVHLAGCRCPQNTSRSPLTPWLGEGVHGHLLGL